MKYRDFKIADLVILSILAVVTDVLGFYLVGLFNMGAPFYITFSMAIGIIAMLRWGVIGVVTYVVAGVGLLFLKGYENIFDGLLFEVIANGMLCIPFLFINKEKKEVIRKDKTKMFLIGILCVLCLSFGKGIGMVFTGGTFLGFINYISSSLLIIIINLLVITGLQVINSDLIRDMDSYIVECQNKEEE